VERREKEKGRGGRRKRRGRGEIYQSFANLAALFTKAQK
jgi:hypothetical protein